MFWFDSQVFLYYRVELPVKPDFEKSSHLLPESQMTISQPHSNPLVDCGKPLFFPLDDTSAAQVEAPPSRHGQSVRTLVRSLSVMQKEALVLNSTTGRVWRLASDEGAYLAGLDEAPCPLAFFSTGMVSAWMEELLALAKARGITLNNPVLVQDNYYTMKGSALKGTMTGGARDVHLQVKLQSEADEKALQSLVQDAVVASPLYGLLRGKHPSYFSLDHNGQALSPGKSHVPESVATDPRDCFDAAKPAIHDGLALIIKLGMTPETEESVTRAGGSLQAEQDRILHLRATCSLRDDGMKQVDVQLFNPHGSEFRFLCEEGEGNGCRGRAPDAASYMAAGLAFCFMTQLGRYASITKKALHDYRIVQDTHFSLGGASSGSYKPGHADPVETHVFLDSGEADEFARRALDMGEQTCFLHAFCRTDLKVHVQLGNAATGKGAE